ncbi:MAG: hypothetical protein OEV93_02525 [Candidatus Moranbacteria bacterium]|nr:hypothetical protein [Candidatus Moranbacteria bacterium]
MNRVKKIINKSFISIIIIFVFIEVISIIFDITSDMGCLLFQSECFDFGYIADSSYHLGTLILSIGTGISVGFFMLWYADYKKSK